MLLVSFCDIVTITICAMFMAMIVVIDEASKIPVVSPVPILRPTTNAPVYYECRDNMVFPVDLAGLAETFRKYSSEFKRNSGATDIEKLMSLDAGNEYFRLDPGLAMMGVMGLLPKPGIKGTDINVVSNLAMHAAAAAKAAMEAEAAASHGGGHKAEATHLGGLETFERNPFTDSLANINTGSQYCVFFVRDSGFNVFRYCRRIVVNRNMRHGWELIGRDEPITFEGMMRTPGFQ